MPEWTRESIRTLIGVLIAKQMNVELQDVKPETNVVEDLGADSLDTVELVMEFEDEFDITIPDAEWEHLHTVRQVEDYLVRLLEVEA